MAARKALAAQIDQKMLWPRERRWLLDLNTNDMAARKALAAQPDHKTLLAAQKSPVVSLANSFSSAACFLPSESLVALLSSCACRHKNSAAFVQSHTCGCYRFDCPASPEKEDQRAAGRPAALTQLALCLRLAPILRPKADNARNPQ